jgi:hypothetical protein
MYIGTQPYSGIRARHTYTATANQTSFSGAGAENVTLTYADELYIDVYQNGVKLSPADYTATSGTTVVLGTGATVSDIIEVIKYDAFSVADTVSAKDGGGFGGNISTSGTLTVTGNADLNGDLDVDGTTNLDVVDVDGAVNFAADVTFADGADIITASAGNNNTRVGTNAGFSIASGGNSNVCIGDEAGRSLTTGDNNIAIGHEALYSENAHGQNIAIGYRSLKALDAGAEVQNTAIGYLAGQAIDLGRENTILGGNAGDALTHADFNVAIGNGSLGADTLGHKSTAVGYATLNAQNFTSSTDSFNTAVGYFAGVSVTTGLQNVLIGGLAGDALTDADFNVAIGYNALTGDTLGSRSVAIGRGALAVQNFTSATDAYNTGIGFGAGVSVNTGIKNTFIGSLAGDAITSGDKNIFIGHDAGSSTGPADTEDGNIIIGNLGGQNCTAANNIGIGDETNFQGHTNAIVMGLNVDSVASNTFTFGKNDGNDRVSNGFTSNATFARVSDVRYKKEIKDNDDCGLDFINDLRPVTFKWKAKSEINKDLPDYDATKTEADHKEKLYGLIAQEVKEALDKNNITDFGGWEKEKTSGINKVAQAMFIYPLIKAVQELSEQVTVLQSEVKKLKGE